MFMLLIGLSFLVCAVVLSLVQYKAGQGDMELRYLKGLAGLTYLHEEQINNKTFDPIQGYTEVMKMFMSEVKLAECVTIFELKRRKDCKHGIVRGANKT